VFGLPQIAASELAVHSVIEAREMLLAALENRHVGATAIVALNAGAAIYVAGRAASLADGVALAQQTIASGAARVTLEHYIRASQA
jgi:anthranilate phosphoribosyltransferase